ncbi:S-layer homology domain-containing protein [Cohnella boryungensis]|uniref:S-layer homology domain-containing protein n=1 Tax=Cohnella boryungensis TaxID=768479 RepID=A0ABV8SCR2_9BACL
MNATAGVQEATVSFVAPSADGGSPITGYRVVSVSDGVEATGSGSPIRVTGLRAGVSYTFTVQAINALGDGPMSAASNAVTPETQPATQPTSSTSIAPTAPGAPSGVSATAGVQEATVSFVAPSADGGSPITGYRVVSAPDGVAVTGSGSPIRVTGLRAGVSYTFTLQAINAVGNGPMSTASNAVTPAAAPDSSDRPDLSDVARHWAEAAVQRAVKLGLMKGYPDGTFRPEDPVTRQEIAVVFIRLLRPDPRHARSVFRDADAISAWASDAVGQAAALNLMAGYGDGTFRPSARLTRSELAVLVRRALALEQVLDASGTARIAGKDSGRLSLLCMPTMEQFRHGQEGRSMI